MTLPEYLRKQLDGIQRKVVGMRVEHPGRMTEIGKQQLSDALISTLDEFRNGQVVSREEQRNRRFNLLHRALLNDDACSAVHGSEVFRESKYFV